jgi:hypothetical protein
MSLRILLVTPWRCGHRSLRWLSVFVLAITSLIAASFGIFAAKPDWTVTSAIVLCFGQFFVWAFHFSQIFLLARDARTLRIPGLERTAAYSLMLYVVLGIVPATLLLGACGGDMVNLGTLLALCTAVGLAFPLLPRYVSVWFGFLPALSTGASKYVSVPGPDSPLFTHWAVPATLLLSIVVVVRWRLLLRDPSPRAQGLRSALVMQYMRTGWGWGSKCQNSVNLLRSRPDWMQARADLRRVGPRWPVRALRVALGGVYVPRTLAGHLRSSGLPFLFLLLCVPVMILVFQNGHGVSLSHTFWTGFSVGVVGSIGIFGTFLLFNLGTFLLRRNWSKQNTELPLLALLPGLGSREQVRRQLLRASLGLPVAGLLALWGLVLIAADYLHMQGLALVSVSLAEFGSAVALVAVGLNVLGGHPMSMWRMRVVSFALLALVALSLFLPLTGLGRHPIPHIHALLLGIILAWAVFSAWLVFIGRRGLDAYYRRPHPFLSMPNPAD